MGVIASDPSSQLAASINGWTRPFSWEELGIRTMLNNHVAHHTQKRAKFTALNDPTEPPPVKHGGPGMSIDELRAVLARHQE